MKTKYRIKKIVYTTGKETFTIQKKILWWYKNMSFPIGTSYPRISRFTIDSVNAEVHYVDTLYDAEQIIKWLSSNIVSNPVILFTNYSRQPLFGWQLSPRLYRYEHTISTATERYLVDMKKLSPDKRIIKEVEYIDVP